MFKKQNDLIKQLTDKQIIQNLYFTQFLLLVISGILGFFLFDSVEDFLALWMVTNHSYLLYGIGAAMIVILIDFIIMKLVPKHFIDDGGINEKLFAKRSFPHIVILTLIIAISEEMLFRGVLQTHFGIWVASLIFAVLHFRYLSKSVLFTMVVAISFLLGIVYDWTETLYTTIIAHFLIDLVFAIQIRLHYLKEVKKGNE
ncbi:CPBP family intramembrane glutamic endopeptidase [uncultured Metabacillus sp.]|uniref:CPBP family intramembrane glutamic endopeptidase n=1 Tax=uncultured Metabacillus sp. TaxID=2860135 RepID=UPI002628D7A8|nr:CPBP family intramembrane glutamic endopeptidase [uncultured Metabacillus sp.]